MAVSFLKAVYLEVPDVAEGLEFYKEFGLETRAEDGRGYARCYGREYDSIVLTPTKNKKRLSHVEMGALNASELEDVRRRAENAKADIVAPPAGFEDNGLWVRNPHGMLFHIVVAEREAPPPEEGAFEINSVGRLNRVGKAGVEPKRKIPPVKPKQFGHSAFFSPDVLESVKFVEDVLGMRLADRAQDVIAFTTCVGGSDHHVLAFAKSDGVGLHHVSFQVNTPDEAGIAGERVAEKTGSQNWGLGRHTIGSNFFHYVQDPWGSWAEYYCDMDYIPDADAWKPTNYAIEDSFTNWAPELPDEMLVNFETMS